MYNDVGEDLRQVGGGHMSTLISIAGAVEGTDTARKVARTRRLCTLIHAGWDTIDRNQRTAVHVAKRA